MFPALLLATALAQPAYAPAPQPAPVPDRETELRRWAGAYQVVHFERDGKPLADAELKKMKVTLEKDGNAIFYYGADGTTSKATPSPEKKPREVDALYTSGAWKGKEIRGIYKVEGDKFTCCYAAPGKARPREFKAPAGSEQTLYTLRRVKE